MRRGLGVVLFVCLATSALACGDVKGGGGTGGSGGSGGSGGADFAIGVAPPNVSVRQGQTATVGVNVTRQGGFAQAVAVSVSSLPTGVTADPLTIPSGQTSGMLTLRAAASAAQGGPTAATVTGSAGSLSHNAMLQVLVSGAPGALDASFGNAGKFTTQVGSRSRGLGISLQPDGKILVVGDGNGVQLVVVRLNPDGTLDSGFGTGGHATAALGVGAGGIAAATTSSGNIVVAGFMQPTSSTENFALVQFSATGGLGFSQATDMGAEYDEADALALQPDGKILTAGLWFNSAAPATYNLAVARYSAGGTLDSSFGSGGKVVMATGANGFAQEMALQTDGKIVLAGGESNDFAAFRLSSGGALDSSFGSGGKVTTDFGGTVDFASGAGIFVDGKIVLAGRSSCGMQNCISAARYTPAGALDPTFGSGGKTMTSIAFFSRRMTLQADGKILISGFVPPQASSVFAVARLGANGSVDTTFGGATGTMGVATVNFGAAQSEARGVAVQADGRIVVVGISGAVGSESIAVARLWP